ncbi:hypothetical protein [Pseudomonas putida]|uniref:hypothetical protein n=1 Tax=Pseudomonas putida TaxID=303 RepID=UPI0003652B4A|nr:hypothetical protein [Pseudomonas putida]
MEGMDAMEIAKLIAGSSFVAAVTTTLITAFKEKLARADERERAAEVEAIFLVRELDLLAVNCANAIREHEEIYHQLRHTPDVSGYPGCAQPELTIIKAALEKIDKSIGAKLAWLENEVRLGMDHIRSAWWHDALEVDEAHEQQCNLVGYFGNKALKIARELRAKYGLPSDHYQWGMDGVEELLANYSRDAKKFLKRVG